MDSKYIHANEARVSKLLKSLMTKSIEDNVPQKIDKAVSQVKVKTGVITRFYPYIDRAKVKLNYNGNTVLCKILHRFGGDMIDFYTPLSSEEKFDNDLKEPYIIPKALQNVCVLDIYGKDGKDYLLLGYFQDEEIVGFNPASSGNIKITSLTEDNQYWIKFGRDGFDYRLSSEPTMKVGTIQDDMDDVEYANVNAVYSKEEQNGLLKELKADVNVNHYNKTDVDNLLEAYNLKFNMFKSLLNILFYDGGIIGSKDDEFMYNEDYIDILTDINGTQVLNKDDSSSRTYSTNKPLTSNVVERDWSPPLTIEFNILSINGDIEFQLYKTNDDCISVNLTEILNNHNKTQGQFKVNYKNNYIKLWLNNDTIMDEEFIFDNEGLIAIRFLLGVQSSFKYKNFVIY